MRKIERNNETREKRETRKRGREMTEIKGKIFSKQQGPYTRGSPKASSEL